MRIAEAEMLLTRYSKENERLAGQNVELRQRRQYLDQDYTGQRDVVSSPFSSFAISGLLLLPVLQTCGSPPR